MNNQDVRTKAAAQQTNRHQAVVARQTHRQQAAVAIQRMDHQARTEATIQRWNQRKMMTTNLKAV